MIPRQTLKRFTFCVKLRDLRFLYLGFLPKFYLKYKSFSVFNLKILLHSPKNLKDTLKDTINTLNTYSKQDNVAPNPHTIKQKPKFHLLCLLS